jgi:hypothetical protein
MTTSARSSRPVVRLTSPGEIAGAVPHLCGFVPTESVVLISLRGPRRRVGLTLRFDLPLPAHEAVLADEAAERLAADGAGRTVAVVYTSDTDTDTGTGTGPALPRRGFVAALRDRCRRRGIEVDDVLLVRSDRWVSYLCSDARCCPREGTPLASARSSGTLGLVAAQQAADGRVVLTSRAQLAASIAGPELLAREGALQALRAAERERDQDRLDRGRRAVNAQSLDRWRDAVRRFAEPPADLGVEEAAALAVSLADVLVRDEVVTWALREHAAVLGTLLALARRTPPPYDAPVCALLAWVAYAEGNGGLANVALERVGVSRPTYSLAVLLRQALDAQVPPAQIRTLLRATSAERRRRRTGLR